MVDNLTKKQRKYTMARVRSKGTTPEWIVRRSAFRLGYRYRLHRNDLPGKPDLVFPSRRKVIFVHGCFWHGHEGCPAARRPSSNTEYWNKKLDRNIDRDRKNIELLVKKDWQVLIVWECETKDAKALERRIQHFLED